MSDLSAFTIFKENASMTVALDISQPILGSGSLKINRNATTGRWVNMVRAGTPNSFTSGRARMLLDATTLQTNDTIGFAFQLSQTNLTASAGSAYAFITQVVSSGTNTWRPFIRKYTAGLSGGTTLATGTDYVAAPGTEKAVEVQWLLDTPNLGGLQVTVKLGSLSTWTDLVVDSALNIIITSSVLTTSVGEGPIYVGLTTSVGTYLYDHIECVPLIVG